MNKNMVKKMDSVEIIASGYEWTCPKCEKLVNEIEVTETVTCPDCEIEYRVSDFVHALSC